MVAHGDDILDSERTSEECISFTEYDVLVLFSFIVKVVSGNEYCLIDETSLTSLERSFFKIFFFLIFRCYLVKNDRRDPTFSHFILLYIFKMRHNFRNIQAFYL